MQTILWFAGICAMWYALKFVFMVFKRLGNKNSINDVLDRMEEGMSDAADKVAKSWKQRKKRKKASNKPIVTIR